MTVTIIRAVIIYIFVIIAVRIMGKRQIGELSNHEFVITILISAVATVPLEDNGIPLTNSLMPILIFISLEIIESALSMKSKRFSDMLEGKPIFIIKDGRLKQKELKRLRISISDLLDNLRIQGVFSLKDVKDAIVETNGKLTVNKSDSGEDIPFPVVIDGKIINEYFGNLKNDYGKIAECCGEDIENILLLTVDNNNNVTMIKKENANDKN